MGVLLAPLHRGHIIILHSLSSSRAGLILDMHSMHTVWLQHVLKLVCSWQTQHSSNHFKFLNSDKNEKSITSSGCLNDELNLSYTRVLASVNKSCIFSLTCITSKLSRLRVKCINLWSHKSPSLSTNDNVDDMSNATYSQCGYSGTGALSNPIHICTTTFNPHISVIGSLTLYE